MRFARLLAACLAMLSPAAAGAVEPPAPGAVRIASFNAALNRQFAGQLVQEMRLGAGEQIRAVAEIIRLVRPDVILINEIDYDERGVSAALLRDLLAEDGEAPGVEFPYIYTGPVNTGLQSGFDLDGDGEMGGPADAFGFGAFPGQYGMAILSRLPFSGEARSFQTLLWADMPGNLIPPGHYGEAEGHLRLSSKSHWDAPVMLPDGQTLHLLASHPTPPVFDGPEDANGRRNHDEIRFWSDYVAGAGWMTDDQGRKGALADGAAFVILGDLNNDPEAGDGRKSAIGGLLRLVNDPKQKSAGAASSASGAGGTGDAALNTAAWGRDGGPGDLRVDYALPSKHLEVTGGGVFWPAPGEAHHELTGDGGDVSSDHRLVWVDIR